MHRTLLPLIFVSALNASAVRAADGPELTIYRSNDTSLFQPGQDSVDHGYAVVHEQRDVPLDKGEREVTLGDLPDFLEPEAVTLHFESGGVKILSQRLMLPQHLNGTLVDHVGKQIRVLGDGDQVTFEGKLLRVNGDGSLVVEDSKGPILLRRYAAVRLLDGRADDGSRLQVRLHAETGGRARATLTYPTHGLGWRAAYTAMLQPGDACRMRLDAQASIANRNGRDWRDANILLIAGQLNTGRVSGVQLRAGPNLNADGRGQQLPAQGALDAYRSYTLPGAIDLPENSITLTPLYASRNLDCERIWRYENGNAWMPPRPMTNPSQNAATSDISVASVLHFVSPETLPEGRLRALLTDKAGHPDFIGAADVADTPKHTKLDLTLGTAFDLRGKRERTAFHYDKSNKRIDEAFRISLSNSGDQARTVDIIEHPNRWTQWTLVSSSAKPVRRSTDTLEFHIEVPARGSTRLDYAVRYQWAAADEQP